MSKLIPSNASTLVQVIGSQFSSNQVVRNLLLSLLQLPTRSDAQLVWLAKLCEQVPSEVLADRNCLLQCATTQLLVLIDYPEFCDSEKLNEFAEQLGILPWQHTISEGEKRTQVKSACVLNDTRLLLASLWDPFLCPEALLPWLAWSVSVDEWDEAWSENLKRQVISDAFAVHQVKGTPYALQKALDSLNIKTEIREWWQGTHSDELPRGTVQVWALINSNLDEQQQGMLTPQMLKRVRRIIESVKRGSIHVDVQLGLAFEESIGSIGVTAPAIVQRFDAPIGQGVKPPKFKNNLGCVGAANVRQSSHLTMAGVGIKPPMGNAISKLSGAMMSNKAQHLSLGGKGVKPTELTVNYGALGNSTSYLSTHCSPKAKGVLPSRGTGNEYLVSVTRQIIYQHFNLQGAA
ncbi:phage tail protein I [Pseudoalteromonas luteoviolacea]|uniref:phage tail protein I n=1 Tax=Pseudoalteromonas luteoviolacea TaxID=43657 RepID=UPI001B37284F|nr:phage tail protein I [Pseudoalteromonas luteoviolacea]MBQ4836292.1 phage tail protein I [Pseudoalteromonas luteoviolacea]